jgi:gliding motility-associated-like protein
MKYAAIVWLCLGGFFANAQTCTGGLGDPIVNITFGAGVGFGQPLAADITNMQFYLGACPSDGQYTITNAVNSNCFSGTWYNVLHDHTGDMNGYFMLINASYDPSDFYVQRVDGLCAGTTYQFAAWALNILTRNGEILPNITFKIEKTDGTTLGDTSVSIPVAAGPQWNQYGFYFTTPPGVTSVVIRMTNNAPGGLGNDLALDDITFRAAGPTIALQVAAFGSDTVSLCKNDPTVLSFTGIVGSCYSSTDYQWQQSADGGVTWSDIAGAITTDYTRTPTSTGNFLYRLKAAQTGNISSTTCSIASNPIQVVVNRLADPAVVITASDDPVCAGLPVNFIAMPQDGGKNPDFEWLVNGTNVASGSTPSFSTSGLADGAVIDCVMTSDADCAIEPTVVSNPVIIAVIPDAVTGVSITASATNVCSDSLVVFSAIPSNGGNTPSYQWKVNGVNEGVDNPDYSTSGLKNGDVVSCVMTGSQVCSFPVASDNTIAMTVYPLPVIQLPQEVIIPARSSIQLSPVITGNIVSYTWNPSVGLDDPAIASPVATPVGNTTYTLQVVSQDGCHSSASETVNVFYDLLMPGGFTPNGDGRNDIFRVPPSVPVSVIRFEVYNRWGLRVFATTNSGGGWDGTLGGKPQPAGVYVWEIEYVDPILKKAVTRGGTVTLVR